MDTYFKFKIFSEYIIPIILIIAIIVIGVIVVTISVIKENRIEKFFLSNGYKRELLGVPSFGDGVFYGWVRESDNTRVDDRDIKGLSFKEIREKYK